ncbi:thioredoxin-disulfide reductase [Desulfolucanica intricata]|uniref:thioredoxin-disulfide reductase n=1 Tax=Desulfolucanica intricata TaxID=1285191 RepID=UPI0008334A56|nr:thioredoxin-disulfide reductase [Desulfolucanica intricata]
MDNLKDLIIIGGGPGGLAAGIYAARADLKTVLIEKGMPGGLAATTEFIENYPGFPEGISGPELAMKMENQAKRFGLEIVYDYVEKLTPQDKCFVIKTGSTEIYARAVIMATGASPQLLGVQGEDELHGRGVSYCATCDGAFFRGKKVAVVGGGDAAVEEALFLTKFAEEVYIIHRRGELRATKIIQQRAKDNAKIKFVWHSTVVKIIGSTMVEGVQLKDVRNGELSNLQVNGVFVYVGTRPSSELVKDLVKTDERGYVLTDENMRTSYPGIFAIGDLRQKALRQVVTAVSDGAIAATAVEKYLEEL